MEDGSFDFNKDTAGHEADRLLRTVTRAFLDNSVVDDVPLCGTCSIVLDIILRNHYQTCEEEICRVIKGVQPRRVHTAINLLCSHGILVFEKRLDKCVELCQPKEKPKVPQRRGFVTFNYSNQQLQQTEEQAQQIKRQEKQKPFYYVNYHHAVELIRYRLYTLLHDVDEKSVQTVYMCNACGKQFNEDQLRDILDGCELVCSECRGRVKPVTLGCEAADEERRKNFRKALQPVIALVNEVMKRSYDPFEQYSPEEEKLIREHEKEAGKKHSSSGTVDDLVDIEESIDVPCPGALSKSARDRMRNRAIPWLVHHGFFTQPSEEEERYIVDEEPDQDPLAAKRPRVSEDAKEQPSLSTLTEEDEEVIRKVQSFDRYLHQRFEMKEEGMDEDVVLDTDSIRSGSAISEETEICSDGENPAAMTSPQQKQSQEETTSIRVCRGFDDDVLASHSIFIGGRLVPLEMITPSDISRMSNDEYSAFAREVALLAGIS